MKFVPFDFNKAHVLSERKLGYGLAVNFLKLANSLTAITKQGEITVTPKSLSNYTKCWAQKNIAL